MLGQALAWAAAIWALAAALPAWAEVRSLQPSRIVVLGTGTEEPAELPYRWDRKHDQSGRLRLEFELPPQIRDEEWGVYFPKIGNSYRVWLGPALIADVGSSEPDRTNTAHRPRFIALPSYFSANTRLVVEIHALAGADGGISALLVGPVSELGRRFDEANRWQVMGAVAVAIASLVLGALALLVWFQQREPVYAYYAMAELCWSLRTVGHYLPDSLPASWPVWGFLMTSLFCLAFAGMCLFGLTLVGRSHGGFAKFIRAFFFGTLVLLAICYAADLHAVWRVWRLILLFVCMACASVVAYEAYKQRSQEAWALTGVCAVALLAGGWDWWSISYQGRDYVARPVMTYTWLLFGVAMAWMLGVRLRRAAQASARHAQEVQLRLIQQEQRLLEVFEDQRRETERQAASAERRRVLQDMHDGVGHELLGALQTSRLGVAPSASVSQQIQRALDHLKLTVDVLQEGSQDLVTMLGALRYRLGARLESAGIQMEWDVGDLPDDGAMDTRRLRDLQMLLYEVFNNLFTHSGARNACLRIAYEARTAWIEVNIMDDGRGYGENMESGNGLGSMHARATRLQGELRLVNGAHPRYAGAATLLRFPLNPEAPSA